MRIFADTHKPYVLAAKGQVPTCHCCQGEAKRSGHYRNKNFNVQRYQCTRCGKSFSEKQPLDGLRIEFQQACQVVNMLCEGMGIRATARLMRMHRDTVLAVLQSAGEKFRVFHDTKVRDVKAEFVQADEVHSFVYSKQRNTDEGDDERGDQFTFMSIESASKLIINSTVGKRTRENALSFMSELKDRTAGRFQLTTDNWNGYSGATASVFTIFGQEVDYATETKYFWKPSEFEPRQLCGIRRKRKIGEPEMRMATTSHLERANLSLRQFTRRFTRCTIGYSKTLENHKSAVALFVTHYNFCRKHSAHGQTPAMAAGLTDRIWKIEEILQAAV